MKYWMTIAGVLVAWTCCGPADAQMTTVSLSSSQNGQSIAPGATIDWSITFSVSAGDNAGLALLVTDLVQNADNPATTDLAPADSVPAELSNFSRPAGISNPGEDGNTTGYVGVLRGDPGARNLIQIGGGQNTFGEAQAPGTGIAENANVIGGVGQTGDVVLASGSFTAPAIEGDYTIELANTVANVIDTLSTPPSFSPAVPSGVDASAGSISFTVAGAGLPGDMNCDGNVSVGDINPFVLALTDPAGYAAAFPDCDINNGDCSNDGNVSVGDINCFVDLVVGG